MNRSIACKPCPRYVITRAIALKVGRNPEDADHSTYKVCITLLTHQGAIACSWSWASRLHVTYTISCPFLKP
jgi:hypothetical protein